MEAIVSPPATSETTNTPPRVELSAVAEPLPMLTKSPFSLAFTEISLFCPLMVTFLPIFATVSISDTAIDNEPPVESPSRALIPANKSVALNSDINTAPLHISDTLSD